MKVQFLGTGTPVPSVKRCGQGILIVHHNHKILIDCGPGVNRRLIEADIKQTEINHLLFTHLHWDHFGDYDALVQTRFILDSHTPLKVYGPLGTAEITDLLFNQVYYRDLVYRRGIRGPNVWKQPEVTEIFGGQTFNVGPFTVSTFRVHHGEFVDYSLAYKVECEGKSVVISGDTAPVLGFEKFAKNCDLLIHEVMPVKPPSRFLQAGHPDLTEEELINMMGHSTPSQVGIIAKQTNPKKLCLIHLMEGEHKDRLQAIADEYDGPIVISEDLMEIEI